MPAILAFTQISTQAQTTIGHLYGSVRVVDPSWSSGYYYIVAVRLESEYPSQTSWHPIVTYIYNPSNDLPFSDINVGSVPYPDPVYLGYYSIGVLVYKYNSSNQFIESSYNSSYAGITVITDGHTRFDPANNPISVKFN